MIRKLLSLFFFIFVSYTALYAQTPETLIHAEGRVVHYKTKEPIVARITYTSLPYGNRVGTIRNSTFSFPMIDKEQYSLLVEAEGFAPAKYLLDPADANADQKVIINIELHEGSSHHRVVGQVYILKNIIFQTQSSKLSPDSYDELTVIHNMLTENPNMVVQLEGHTDYLGTPSQNMKLSQHRVEAVKNFLVAKGINKNRIKTKAFGGTQPLSRDDTPEAHRLNRRIELRILEN
jgi:OmpA-OmpF porin, OOP family